MRNTTLNGLAALLIRWLPAIAIMVFIYWLSARTGPEIKSAGLGREEYHVFGHFWMFFFLCVAMYRGVKNPFVAVLLTVIYALTDEFHQRFTFGRSSGISDILNDSFAASLAGLILWKLYSKLPKILKSWLEK